MPPFFSPPTHRLPVPRSLVTVGSEGMATQLLTDEALVSHVIFSHSLPEAQTQRVGLLPRDDPVLSRDPPQDQGPWLSLLGAVSTLRRKGSALTLASVTRGQDNSGVTCPTLGALRRHWWAHLGSGGLTM